MKLRIWVKNPIEVDIPVRSVTEMLEASPKELEDFVNKNWLHIIQPGKEPTISSVEVVS